MKRILAVLALLAACGLAFSVTGQIYVRYLSDGSIEKTMSWAKTLEDLRVGKPGTGFDLNFDDYGVTYRLRGDLSLYLEETGYKGWLINGYDGYGVGIKGGNVATSPGYLQFNNIKLGEMTMAIGGAWWHLDETKSKTTTNVGAVTNAGAIGYNKFAFDFNFNVPVADGVRLSSYAWDRIMLSFGFGDSSYNNNGGTTNTATESGYKFILPVHLIMGFDAIGLEIFPKLQLQGGSTTLKTVGTVATNSYDASSMKFGVMGRLNYTLNEMLTPYADLGFAFASGSVKETTMTTTNVTTTSALDVPIMAGVTVKIAPMVKMNIGLGYVLKVFDNSKLETSGGTTNNTATSGGLSDNYGYFDEHWYQHPFLSIGGSAGFADGWELGLNTVVGLWSGASTGDGGARSTGDTAVSSTSDLVTTKQGQVLYFFQQFNWDSNAWLKFSKDNVEIKGTFGGQNATTGNDGLAGLFSSLDMAIKF